MDIKYLTGGVAAIVLALSTAAGAATFNFNDIADNTGGPFLLTNGLTTPGGEGGWASIIGAGLGVVDGGIGVIASGSNANQSAADAYLDAGNAGLGVCSSGTAGGSCAGNSDDNVNGSGSGETLKLSFVDDATDSALGVNISSILFRKQNHGLFNGIIDVFGGELTVAAGLVTANLNLLQTGSSMYSFIWDGTNTGDKDFYIDNVVVAPVPIPPALLLFASALGGLGFLSRRRKANA